MKNRISDDKAHVIFEKKNVPLAIFDTLINDRRIHYAVSGSAAFPTLVFIHGSPGSWMNYMKFMYDSALLTKFRLVSIDRPGFGHRDFGDAMRLKDQCMLILPVLRALRNDGAMYLCGHSLGGPVVVQLAALDTSLFEKIIVVAGGIDVKQEKPETWRRLMAHRPLYWLLPGAFAPSNTELLYLKEDLIPLQSEFEKIKCNVQFIHGDKDTWVPIENIAYGKSLLSNAASVTADTIFGADHQIPWKNREALRDLLLKCRE